MKRALIHFLVVGVPGLCFVVAGVLNDEYIRPSLWVAFSSSGRSTNSVENAWSG